MHRYLVTVKEVTCIATNKNGSLVVSGSEDGTVQLWDVSTGMPQGALMEGHEG